MPRNPPGAAASARQSAQPAGSPSSELLITDPRIDMATTTRSGSRTSANGLSGCISSASHERATRVGAFKIYTEIKAIASALTVGLA